MDIKDYYLISPNGIIVGTVTAGYISRDYKKNIIEIYSDEDGICDALFSTVPITWVLVPVESIKVV